MLPAREEASHIIQMASNRINDKTTYFKYLNISNLEKIKKVTLVLQQYIFILGP